MCVLLSMKHTIHVKAPKDREFFRSRRTPNTISGLAVSLGWEPVKQNNIGISSPCRCSVPHGGLCEAHSEGCFTC